MDSIPLTFWFEENTEAHQKLSLRLRKDERTTQWITFIRQCIECFEFPSNSLCVCLLARLQEYDTNAIVFLRSNYQSLTILRELD